jgi:DNA-binding response OmpR family regulator
VLLVDDDEDMAEACRAALENAGYAVIVCTDGDHASNTLKLVLVDVIVVDIFVPGKDGFEIIRECKKLAHGAPVLAISGGGGIMLPRGVLEDAARLGAAVTLAKPFSSTELVDAVKRALKSSRSAHVPRLPPDEVSSPV